MTCLYRTSSPRRSATTIRFTRRQKRSTPNFKASPGTSGRRLYYPRIDELPEAVIDLLAWQWHVDFYELARTLEMKRKAVKGSIRWHRKKGTVWAIRKALAMLDIESEIVEWWKIEGAAPYTFGVKAEITSGFWSKHPDAKDATKAIPTQIGRASCRERV